jgi:hypothetical protein
MRATCRSRRADTKRLVDFVSLPSGIPALVALIVGFVASIPFQNATLGYDIAANYPWLPINWATVNVLHGADVAYYVGFIVAGVVLWFGSRAMRSSRDQAPEVLGAA